ncbi:MAG: hypothetical protein AAGA62_18185 [Bacteroidota bacterium]
MPANEYQDRGHNVSVEGFIHPTGLTDGELGAILLHRQLDIYSQFYPECKDYGAAKSVVEQQLKTGIHDQMLNAGGCDLARGVQAH